mgnify:CR=1 FL=1
MPWPCVGQLRLLQLKSKVLICCSGPRCWDAWVIQKWRRVCRPPYRTLPGRGAFRQAACGAGHAGRYFSQLSQRSN